MAAAPRGASLDPPPNEQDNSCQGIGDETRHPANSSWISDMVTRKPSGQKASRAGRLGATGRNNDVGDKAGSATERLRARRRSTKAAGREPAQEPAETPIANAEPAAASGELEPTAVGSSKPTRKARQATAARRASADREKPHKGNVSEGKSADSSSPTAAKPPRKPAQKPARPALRASPAASPGSPHARKTPEPHLAPRAASPMLTTPTTLAAAAAELSPELGLSMAQALSAELAGLSHRLLEAGSASAQQMASARSVPELIEIQARQLQALSEAWLEHTSRVSEIYLSAVGPSTRR
jgi:hypothetical protein